jgi:hypothetical protein
MDVQNHDVLPAGRLRALRQAKGYQSAREAAEALSWDLELYRAHEAGTRQIDHTSASAYGKGYGMDPSWILFGVWQAGFE